MRFGYWNKLSREGYAKYEIDHMKQKLGCEIAQIADIKIEVREHEQSVFVMAEVHAYSPTEFRSILDTLRLLKRMSLSHSREMQIAVDELTDKIAGPVIKTSNGMYNGPQTSNTF
jgi:hypothetical protein